MSEKKTTLSVPGAYVPLLEDIRLLKSDEQNPNRTTVKQREQIWKSLSKYGWTYPIIVNKDGVFADGEQRVEVLREHGEFFAPVLRLSVSDVDRRMLRQILNKLRGSHNKELDAAEFKRIADLGEKVTDDARLFAATREPIAGFLTGGSDGQRGFPKTIVEKWFTINDVTTKDPDPELDRALQKEFRRLKYKRVLTGFVGAKFLYGNTLLVGSYDDVNKLSVLETERPQSANLMQLEVFPKINYSVFNKDTNQDSLRYGLPLVYQVNDGSRTFRVHWTRCFEHVGVSILDLIWDDLTCGRNIRWGVGQWVFRVGGGFVVITFPKETMGKPTSKAQLQDWANSKEWSNITHRTY